MTQITTHVLDTARGRPAAGVGWTLERRTGEDRWAPLASGLTGADGRHAGLLPAGSALQAGAYRLTFATGAWFAAQGLDAFWPRVQLEFAVTDPGAHHHLPLLLSPYGYSTYRGG